MSAGRFSAAVRFGLALLGLLSLGCGAVRQEPPEAVHGVLDLRAWKPLLGHTVRLDGEWRYYPRRVLSPGDPALQDPPPAFTRVPSTWDRTAAAPDDLPGHGFATFGLTVLLPPDPPALALRVITVSTAFRLFADGALAAEAGVVASSADQGRPGYRPQVRHLSPSKSGKLELILQASNFDYAKGGVWEPIWIGLPSEIDAAREARVALALFLAGSFAAIGLYHLMLWGARHRDRSPLYFAIVCFAMALRGLTVDEVFLVNLLPGLRWTSLVRLEYGSLLTIVAAVPLFLYEIFPQDQPRALVRAYSFSAIAGLATVAVLPPDWFSRGLFLIQLLCVSAALVGSVLVARSLSRHREGAGLFLIGLAAIALTGTHDVLVSIFRSLPTSHWLVTSIYLQPFGLFVFILSQATLLAIRSSGAFVDLEKASAELRVAHAKLDAHARELEDRVASRTAELEEANRQLARLAEIDGLTQVGNRRFFEEELRRAWFDHLRSAAPLSLVLVDVDHFKAYNDRYGHTAGDETLRRVAQAITQSIRRPGDSVARYGGEELVALLPKTDQKGALHLAEEIRHRVETEAIAHEASGVAPVVTVSIGVATVTPESDHQQSELFESADRALYQAKQQGRNRVVAG